MFQPSERAKERPATWAMELMEYEKEQRARQATFSLVSPEQTVLFRKFKDGRCQILSLDGLIILEEFYIPEQPAFHDGQAPVRGFMRAMLWSLPIWALIIWGICWVVG